ncbi:hypothetical protein Hdeb2414_s0007g00260621 [Helianthus debilis subsp. tardiflorus]
MVVICRLAGATFIAPVFLQDQWSLRVAHHSPSLTYWWNTQKWFPSLTVIAHSPDILSRQDRELKPVFTAGRAGVEEQVRQQGEYESIHRDLNIGFGTWEFDPTEIKNPFPENEGSVHIWQGDEDILVPVTLQRYIARPGKRVGSGRVMGQNGFGSKWVRFRKVPVETVRFETVLVETERVETVGVETVRNSFRPETRLVRKLVSAQNSLRSKTHPMQKPVSARNPTRTDLTIQNLRRAENLLGPKLNLN